MEDLQNRSERVNSQKTNGTNIKDVSPRMVKEI